MGFFLCVAMFRFTLAVLALFCLGALANHIQLGNFQGTYTSEFGLGTFMCQNGVINYLNFVKETILRPSAAQCGRLSTDRNLNLEGRYINTNLLTLDLCFRDPDDDAYDDDDETVQGSLQREENGVIIDQYITGFWHDN